MRYIITGGTGHIGNNLIRYIRKAEPDAEIIAPVRRAPGFALEDVECLPVLGDLSDEKFLRMLIRPGDTVIHLAALIDLTDKRRTETMAVNYGITRTICRVCREIGHVRFLYFGSVDAIYHPGNIEISEPEFYDPAKIEGNYGQSKALAANYVLGEIRRNSSFSAAILLPSAVIGPDDRKPSAVGKVILGALRGAPEFGIEGGYNFVDVRDVCKAAYALCTEKRELRGQFILSGHNVTVKELYEQLNRICGIKHSPTMIPTALVNFCLPFVKVLNRLTIKALADPHDYSCEKARQELGFEPRPFEETLKDTVRWFATNRKRFRPDAKKQEAKK